MEREEKMGLIHFRIQSKIFYIYFLSPLCTSFFHFMPLFSVVFYSEHVFSSLLLIQGENDITAKFSGFFTS